MVSMLDRKESHQNIFSNSCFFLGKIIDYVLMVLMSANKINFGIHTIFIYPNHFADLKLHIFGQELYDEG